MPKPLLHFGDVRSLSSAFVAAVARSECTQNPTASIFATAAYFLTTQLQIADPVIDRSSLARPDFNARKQRSVQFGTMAGGFEVIRDTSQGSGMGGHEANFVALAMQAQMPHPAPVVEVAYLL